MEEVKCIVCGCSQFNPCVDEATGEACSWVEFEPGVTQINGGGLCTFCFELGDQGDVDFMATAQEALRRGFRKPADAERDEPLVQLYSDYEATQFLRSRAAGA